MSLGASVFVCVQVMGHAEAAKIASLIFLCVHREHYGFLPKLAPILQGKVNVLLSAFHHIGAVQQDVAVFNTLSFSHFVLQLQMPPVSQSVKHVCRSFFFGCAMIGLLESNSTGFRARIKAEHFPSESTGIFSVKIKHNCQKNYVCNPEKKTKKKTKKKEKPW